MKEYICITLFLEIFIISAFSYQVEFSALSSEESLSSRLDRTKKLLEEIPLIDGHNDLPWNIRKFIHNNLDSTDFSNDIKFSSPWLYSKWSHTDLPRLKQGSVGAQFWVAYVPCESQFFNAVQLTLEQIDVIKRFIERYSAFLTYADSADKLIKVHKEGKIAALIGLEGGHSIGNSLATLRMMYDLGVRYVTLTHTCQTPWAASSIVNINPYEINHHDTGLTVFGKRVILEMNRLGMMVDLSHVSFQTMRDAIKISQAPVIFSHSCAYTICNHSRNIPDDVLMLVKANKGIVMVPFFTNFLTCKSSATIKDVVDHINYIRDTAGIDHVGIGSDFDGINRTPMGLEDVSKYPYLFAELMKSEKWSEEDLKKLAGLNFLRVFKEVEAVRDRYLEQAVEPDENVISKEELDGFPTNCLDVEF